MPATPIIDPVSGESLVGTEPQLLQQIDPGWWRQRLNLYTGRALTVSALDSEQSYRGGLLATLGQAVTAGTVTGLALSMDLSGADPLLTVSPGYGITASGQDVALNSTLKAHLSTLAVIDAITGDAIDSFHQLVGDPANSTYAGILLLQPVVAQVSGQMLDTGTGPIVASGNLNASCDQDPEEYAFEDWQIADAVRLVYLPWPSGVPALPLPPMDPQATWRNRLAYAIFEAEAQLGPDDQLPWAMLGLPIGLIAFDPGVAWKASTAYTAGQFITDRNGNLQVASTAGTSGAAQPKTWNTTYGGATTDGTVKWTNSGLAWKPLFIDCSSVVRAGGLPRRRFIFPSQAPPVLQWQSQTAYAQGDFIIDSNNNVQTVKKAGTSDGPPPQWNTTFGKTTTDGAVTWVNNGPASWQPNTAFAAGQFIFDSNGNVQQIQTAGATGSTEPNWNGIYLPTADGTVTWINNGSGNPPIVQPSLAQARINQLSEQLSQTMAQRLPFQTLADICPTLPPSGILPVSAVDFKTQRASWLPPNWTVSAAPVHLEELETVLETGMTLEPLDAESTAPKDATLLEPVELLVPLPDAVYDPSILVVETVAPIFAQEVEKATDARNLTLKQLKAVQQETNSLLTALGPNVPVNTSLIHIDAGLTPDELAGRNTPPPYTPTSTEIFAALLPTTWRPSIAYTAGQFVIDSNGATQVVLTAGTSAATSPAWATTDAQTTTDGTATWLNNGPLAWQPDTAYIKGQFIIDPNGFMQIVTSAGTSASTPPAWPQPEKQGQTTSDGIIWQTQGKALWKPDTSYTTGQFILDAAGNIQIVQSGGISADSAPSWNPNSGQTTQDSAVVWQNLGHSAWQPNTHYSAGQAILDTNGNIQLATIGGTSGASAPAWKKTVNNTTLDATITWTTGAQLTWQPRFQYPAAQIIIDSNGNLQLAAAAGVSGANPPVWNTTPNGTTTDSKMTWTCIAFNSVDVQQLKSVAAQAPYTKTFQDSAGKSYTISLLSTDDLNNLDTNGLQALINDLSARIKKANDLLDTSFLTTQTDIYRFRQNVLGATAATTLATSPVLANIATGETAAATAENLQNYINALKPPPSTVTPGFTPAPPSYTRLSFIPIREPVLNIATASPAGTKPLSMRSRAITTALHSLQTVSRTFAGAAATSTASTQTASPGAAPAPSAPATATFKASSQLISKVSAVNLVKAEATLGPTQIIFPGQNATATTTDITNQSPLVGAQLNLRTLTIAERLQQSPSQESMFYGIANRLSFLQVLETLENDLNLVADDLPILVDNPPATAPTTPTAVPVEMHTFAEWLGPSRNPSYPNNQAAILAKLQSPYLVSDSAEATLFSVGVRVVEQHTMLLRALEARVQQYADFVTLCNTALQNIQSNIGKARTYATQLYNNLLQERQNVAFTSALLADETQRVQNVNAQRASVLAGSVQLVAYTRARTLEATDTAPSRQLEPANVGNPVPACLQQSVAIPPELREIVAQLREAPLSWMPSIGPQVNKLDRPSLLQQLAISVQARAAQMLQLPLFPSSASGESGVYASTIAAIHDANQQTFRNFQTQRAALQPAAITSLSWSAQAASLQAIAAINDLIAADVVHTEISNAVARLIQQISSVATCLYTRASIALPIDRLAWAEFLRGSGLSISLRSLAVLPKWNDLAYTDRQQMQMLVDWLFLQIDAGIAAASAFMSDVVRTAILLASDVPIDNIISGGIIIRTQPSVGGIVSLTLPSDRIAAGMYVNLYSGVSLAARAVVSDLDSSTVRATVTDVFTPGTYLETTDTAHFTTLAPQAVALRPFS
jgi:hypothetical protein